MAVNGDAGDRAGQFTHLDIDDQDKKFFLSSTHRVNNPGAVHFFRRALL